MDANQQSRANPFGMDEHCRNCPALCETRTQVVHGYGDVAADFLFVGERPSTGADEVGVPFAGDERGERFQRILQRLGLCMMGSPLERPTLQNVYLTTLTRCRDPERRPTDEEVDTCEPYLNAEIRMINPQILIPVGERALAELAREYTTTPADRLDLERDHATTVRGRGFELVPMIDPLEQTDDQTQDWVEHFAALMASDYRQTKGSRER
ncbi:uracil-DNA glycosylase [Natronobiforma cellulositropha]|uniref:uracil-DNA glycosylase n=1 Tax=Natronobiforma cellulositropha TaxID=1679076 RepID=UPI0021D5F06C|nr:uracil-DNA glycosylase [Natronobiforma cellulositropha]